MKATVRTSVRKIRVPRIPGWVGLLALACALLLSSSASVLPERWQDTALYLGVGLAFASVGGIVFGLLMAGRPDWQGAGTVAGIILGLMPLLVVWSSPRTGKEVHNNSTAVAPSAGRTRAPGQAQPVPQAQSVRQVQSRRKAQSLAETQTRDAQLERVLAEISALVEGKTRTAVERQDAALLSIAQGRGRMPNVKSRLTSAAHDLEEVQSALADVRANNARAHGELLTVIGDTTPLEGLIAALRNLRASLDDAADDNTLKQQAEEPRSAALLVGQWIADCSQRIADLRKGASSDAS